MKFHQGRIDVNGNFRDRSRSDDGHVGGPGEDLPFPGLVVAWYPKSQTIDVAVSTRFGAVKYEGVSVYGSFFESTGMIYTPKIATTEGEDGYSTVLLPDQENPDSDQYVLDNHIEALLFKTSFGYAASCFRFISADSQLLNNAKSGRKITRHDDGSYSIHDEDGNMFKKHPSGFSIKIGKSIEDIILDDPFLPHDKNEFDYESKVSIELKIPSEVGEHKITFDAGKITLFHGTGSIFEYDDAGLLAITSSASKNLKTIIDSFITEVSKIVVANGTGPDVGALTQLRSDLAELLK